MTTKNLLNCPLCNAEPKDVSYGIECPNCHLWLPAAYKDYWNKRDGCNAMVEELIALREYERLNNGG